MIEELSYTKGGSDIALLTQTIGEKFDEIVAKYPDTDALISKHQNVRLTWRELGAIVDQAAKALIALGAHKGDRLGIWAPNCSQWLVTQFATAKVGIIMVNINPAYRLNELEFALKQSGCRWLITEAKFKSSDYHAMLNKLLPELKTSRIGHLYSAKLPDLRGIMTLGKIADPGMLSWKEALKRGDEVSDAQLQAVSDSLNPFEPINIQYTSGTTGFPKGATLSHHNILNNGYMVGESLRYTEKDRVVIPVPLFHCFGMVMGNLAAMTHGSTIIYPNDSYDPELSLKAAAEERATSLYGVPTMFIGMLTYEGRKEMDLSNLRTGIMAGTTCPIEIMRYVISDLNMSEVQICYGMTETSPVSIQTAHDDNMEKRTTTAGRTQPHLENKIIDENGEIVKRGEIGELCTRGYSVMIGYWNNPDETDRVIDAEKWMHSGDLAIMDDEGYVQIVGRNSDMIIRGGENVYPREIEEFLITHDKIVDVHVIGIPSEKFGEEIEAWIKVIKGGTLTKEDIHHFCRDQIAHYKVPKYVRFVDDFPMTISGKIQKFRMREISIEDLGNVP